MAKARTPRLVDLRTFIARFGTQLGRRDRLSACEAYLTGLLAGHSSIKRSVASSAATPHALRQFVNRSPWDDEAILSGLRAMLFSRDPDPEAILVLTEVYIRKKGRHSVGVHAQSASDAATGPFIPGGRYQCVVMWCWVTKTRAWPIAARLYLPPSWTLSTRKSQRGGIPARFSNYQDKTDIALDLLGTIDSQLKTPRSVIVDKVFTGEIQPLVGELEKRSFHYLIVGCHPQPPRDENDYPDWFSPEDAWIRKVAFLQCLRDLEQTVSASVKMHGGAGIPLIRLASDIGVPGPKQSSPQRFVLCHRERADYLQLYITNEAEGAAARHVRMVLKLKAARRMCAKLLENGGLRRFEGRTWRGFHHHITLCFMAYYFSMQQRKQKRTRSHR